MLKHVENYTDCATFFWISNVMLDFIRRSSVMKLNWFGISANMGAEQNNFTMVLSTTLKKRGNIRRSVQNTSNRKFEMRPAFYSK